MNAQGTFREIFDQAPVGMAHVTLEGNYVEVNRRLCEITGYSRDELLATSWRNITHPDDLPATLDMHAKFKSDDLDSHTFEKRYIRKDGRVIWVKVTVSPMRDPENREPLYHIVSIDEITEYKRAQELLSTSEERFSKAFRKNPAAIAFSSVETGRFVEVNDALESLTGYSRQEVVGRTALELDIWVDPASRQQIIDAVLAEEPVQGWEITFRAKDGRILDGLAFADKIDFDGQPCILWAVMDITDRKRAQEQIRRAHELLRNTEEKCTKAFHQNPAAIMISSVKSHCFLEVNDAFARLTGYSREEVIGRTSLDLNLWAEPAQRDQLIAAVVAGEHVRGWERLYRAKDGRIFTGLTYVDRIEVDGQPCLISTVIDISDQKLAQEQIKHAQELLARSEEKFSTAFRQSPTAVLVSCLKTGIYLEVNDAFERLTGYTRQEAVGRTAFDLNVWVDPNSRQKIVDTVLAGERVQGWEIPFRRKDGGIFTGLTFVDKIYVDEHACLIWAVMDITDRKRLESELQDLSGRLIEAQDEERRQLAEELSNSLGQSIAVVSFEMAQLARTAHGELGRGLSSVGAKIRDVAAGIGTVSQRLHPSGLEFTGLPWAIESLCRQFTHLYALQVAFKHESIPVSLPQDIALALFRIVQEGLSNVVRHSGKRQAWIELEMNPCCIRLTLWDEGVGFNSDTARTGLGLLTMRERCRRLNGSFSIHNKTGTRLEAHIPIPKTQSDEFDVPVPATHNEM